MVKLGTILLLALVLLSSCFSAPTTEPPTSTPACMHSGTTQWLTVDPIGEIGLHLPPCYQAQGDARYPVLYLLPGAGGDDRNWLSAGVGQLADDMTLHGEIPPLIIVATGETFKDFYGSFIVGTLLPYIESHTRASPDRHHRAVAGGSLGGASAYYLVFQRPDLFASAGVFGNGLVVGKEAEIRSLLKSIPPSRNLASS